MKKIWKLCIPKKICGTTPICSYQENNCFEDIYDNTYDNDENKNEETPEFTISERVENMCIRWKISPEEALYLIRNVDGQQTQFF